MFQAPFLPFASPVCDWECKGKKIFFNLQILFLIKIKFFCGFWLLSLLAKEASSDLGVQKYEDFFIFQIFI
jgi:hypothetical protein